MPFLNVLFCLTNTLNTKILKCANVHRGKSAAWEVLADIWQSTSLFCHNSHINVSTLFTSFFVALLGTWKLKYDFGFSYEKVVKKHKIVGRKNDYFFIFIFTTKPASHKNQTQRSLQTWSIGNFVLSVCFNCFQLFSTTSIYSNSLMIQTNLSHLQR